MAEIHIGMIQGRHEIEGAPFTDYIWGEHLIDEGIMKWGEHPHTGEKVLELVDPDDNDPETSTHRRVAGEWIIQNVLNHPLLIENIDILHHRRHDAVSARLPIILGKTHCYGDSFGNCYL